MSASVWGENHVIPAASVMFCYVIKSNWLYSAWIPLRPLCWLMALCSKCLASCNYAVTPDSSSIMAEESISFCFFSAVCVNPSFRLHIQTLLLSKLGLNGDVTRRNTDVYSSFVSSDELLGLKEGNIMESLLRGDLQPNMKAETRITISNTPPSSITAHNKPAGTEATHSQPALTILRPQWVKQHTVFHCIPPWPVIDPHRSLVKLHQLRVKPESGNGFHILPELLTTNPGCYPTFSPL